VHDLEVVEHAFLEALQRGDMSASGDLLRDDFLITTAGWLAEPVGKRAWLEALTGRMTLEHFDIRLIATRRYGDVGVVLAESSQEGTHDRAPVLDDLPLHRRLGTRKRRMAACNPPRVGTTRAHCHRSVIQTMPCPLARSAIGLPSLTV